MLIKNAIEQDNSVTAGSITSGIIFKCIYFILKFIYSKKQSNFRKLIES